MVLPLTSTGPVKHGTLEYKASVKIVFNLSKRIRYKLEESRVRFHRVLQLRDDRALTTACCDQKQTALGALRKS